MFIYETYVLEGDANAKFSLSEIWNLLQADPLPNNASNFCKEMINCIGAWNSIKKTSGPPLNLEIIKQTHKIMMHKEKHQDGKDVLVEEYRESPAFAGYDIFAPIDLIEIYMEDSIFRFHETKKKWSNYSRHKFV